MYINKHINFSFLICLLIIFIIPSAFSQTKDATVALKPPMGWNSYDCFKFKVTEQDVRANAEYMAKNLKSYGWEYIIGSIHFFNRFHKKIPVIMDCQEDFIKAYDVYYQRNIKALCKDYYKLVQTMIKTDWFKINVVGHFDFVKKYNYKNKFFDERENWYQNLVLDTLDVIKKSVNEIQKL